MTEVFLIDTCIWRDFYENRVDKSKNLLGEHASKLFIKILKNNYKILFSESLLWELKKDYNERDIKDMLTLLIINNNLMNIKITKEEYSEAKILSEKRDIPFVDCLNAIQARNNKATVITRDRHFDKLSDIAKVLKPEQVK